MVSGTQFGKLVVLSLMLLACRPSPHQHRSGAPVSGRIAGLRSDTLPEAVADGAAGQVEMRAVSLRVLQEELAGSRCSDPEPLYLGGLTRVDGYVLDYGNGDIILYGERRAGAPLLHTQDFAVALRNVWGCYTQRRGDTVFYSYPSCTIDPIQDMLRRQDLVAARIRRASTMEENARAFAEWCEIGKEPESVKVFGVPHRSHFARVMVDADYYMKRLADGSETLGLEGFFSLFDMRLAQACADAGSGRRRPFASFNRFWFCAGNCEYGEDEGIVQLQTCPVILMTEEQFMTRTGLGGSGKPEPMAAEFAARFTGLYDTIALLRPLYQQLAGLYRLVAIARILRSHDPDAFLGYLLNDLPLDGYLVPVMLPGLTRLVELKQEGSYQWLASCGGVEMRLEPQRSRLDQSGRMRLAALRERIIASRRSSSELSWRF